MEIKTDEIIQELSRHGMPNAPFSHRHAFLIGARWCRRKTFEELEEKFPSAVSRIKAEMGKEEYLVFSGQK